MNGKIFDNRGFLNEEGKKATIKLKQEIAKLLDNCSAEDFLIVGSILHKIVGDMVCDAAQEKRNLKKEFSSMTDEEFSEYLTKKYQPIYGERWVLKAPLTDEEGERSAEAFRSRMQKAAENLKKNPPKITRSGIPPRGRGKYID